MMKYSYDEIYELYINQNLTVRETEQKLNIGKGSLASYLRKYDIKKPSSLIALNRQKSVRQKYGVDNVFKLDTVQDKIKATTLEKYGTEHAMQSEEVKSKHKEIIQQRYGVDNVFKLQSIRDKAKETMLDKYAVEHSMQSDILRSKVFKTNKSRYGNKSYLGSKENRELLKTRTIRDKIERTNKKRYGHKHYFKTKHYKDILTKRHGTYKIGRLKIDAEIRDIIHNKDNLIKWINEQEFKTVNYLANKLSYDRNALLNKCKEYNIEYLLDFTKSTAEQEIREYIESKGFKTISTRTILDGKEIDIYIPDLKLGIEYNGTYWHQVDFVGKKYHQEKSILAEEKGIQLYHIFEYDWTNSDKKERILNQLNNLLHINDRRIYARQCQVKEIGSEVYEFLDNNHMQGRDRSSVKLGLYYKEELVSVMTFTKPRFNKKYEWELSRFATKSNMNVIGGASKLFKYFIRHNKGSIISYSDIARTSGKVYEILGFKQTHITTPNYVWVKNSEVLSRYQTQMRQEKETMSDRGYIQIFDAGNKAWEYRTGE